MGERAPRFKIKVAYFGAKPAQPGGPPRDPRNAAAKYLRYISHREEQLPRGETRTLYGIGARYRELRGDEAAIAARLRADADGVRMPRYYRGILTISDDAAARLALLRPQDAERTMRDAVDRVFRRVLRDAQGAFAIHTHGGPKRPNGHLHAHFILSPIDTNQRRVALKRPDLSRFREQWTELFEKELQRALVRYQVAPAGDRRPERDTRRDERREPQAARPSSARSQDGTPDAAKAWPSSQDRDARLTSLRQTVTKALEDHPTLPQFVERLERQGVNVRLQRGDDGEVPSVGYRVGRTFVRGDELGPGHRWARVQKQLTPDPDLDQEVSRRLSRVFVGDALRPSRPLVEQVAPDNARQRVAQVVDASLQDRPSFTEFVRRVEGAGVEVRLFRSADERILSIGYAVEGQYVAARHLPPGHSWTRLHQRLDLDRERDAAAIDLVSERVQIVAEDRSGPTLRKAPSPEQVAHVRAAVDQALDPRGTTLTAFARSIEARGVEVRILVDRQERLVGVHYALGGVPVSPAQLGDQYAIRGLRARGLLYDARGDRPLIQAQGRVLSKSVLIDLAEAYRLARGARAVVAHPVRQLVTQGIAAVARAHHARSHARAYVQAMRRQGGAPGRAILPGLPPFRLLTRVLTPVENPNGPAPFDITRMTRAVGRRAMDLWVRAMPRHLRTAIQVTRTVGRVFRPSDDY